MHWGGQTLAQMPQEVQHKPRYENKQESTGRSEVDDNGAPYTVCPQRILVILHHAAGGDQVGLKADDRVGDQV